MDEKEKHLIYQNKVGAGGMHTEIKKKNVSKNNVVEDSSQERRAKLLSLAESVLTDLENQSEFDNLMQKFEVTQKEVLTSFLDYNLDINLPQGNDIYNSLPNRIVLHVHNLLKDSWHIGRQKIVLDFLKNIKVDSIVDIGFGIPSQYIRDHILTQKKIKLTLCDCYEAAFTFAESLLTLWNPTWRDVVSFKNSNMDNREFVGSFDAYLFLDSIEHTKEPTRYLKKYIRLSPSEAYFIISLPIGPLFARHYMAWESDHDAENWLNDCGLEILGREDIYVNPHVDLFAEQLGYNYHNIITLCRKQKQHGKIS